MGNESGFDLGRRVNQQGENMGARLSRLRRFAGSVLHDTSERLQLTAYRLFPALMLMKGFSEIASSEQGFQGTMIDGDNYLDRSLADIYERHLFVATCVNYVAQRVASPPLTFYRTVDRNGQTEREVEDSHPVAEVFRWWNPHTSAFEAWETVASWWLLTGVAYIAILESDNPKYQFELWPMFTPGVTVIRGETGVMGYRYRVEGTETVFASDEVIALRSFSTTRRFGGTGKLEPGRKQIGTDLRAREWNDRLLKEGVHTSGTLTTEDDLGPQKAKKIRESFMKDYAGAEKAARIMVLYGGLKYDPTTFAHKDIMWMEQLKMTQEDISLAIGVPLEVLGTKSPNRAALEEKRRIFWEDTVKPIGSRFVNVLNSTVLPRLAPELEAGWDYEDIDALQPNRTEQYNAGRTAVSAGLLTINEYRRDVLKKEPVEGGDVILIGRGLMPISEAISATPAQELRARKSVSKAEDELVRTIEVLRGRTETRLQGIIRRASRQMEGTVLERVSEGLDANSLAGIEQTMIVENGKLVADEVSDELLTTMQRSGKANHIAVGIGGDQFKVRNTAAERVLRQQRGSVLGVGRRQATQLRASLAEGLANGESEKAMRSRVLSFFRGERDNSLTIARTETSRAINASAKESYLQARTLGVDVEMEWRASQDELVRSAHAEVHGTRIDPETEVFVVAGEHLEYPGDRDGGSPENTINCRCATIPVVVADHRRSGRGANGNGDLSTGDLLRSAVAAYEGEES
jgi:HK97 family phage portal protein